MVRGDVGERSHCSLATDNRWNAMRPTIVYEHLGTGNGRPHLPHRRLTPTTAPRAQNLTTT